MSHVSPISHRPSLDKDLDAMMMNTLFSPQPTSAPLYPGEVRQGGYHQSQPTGFGGSMPWITQTQPVTGTSSARGDVPMHFFTSPFVHLPTGQDDCGNYSALPLYPVEDVRDDSLQDDSHQDNSNDTDRASNKAERNRKAQKRFRDRQKVKLSTLEQQFSQISEHFSKLAAENEKLKLKSDILGKMLQCREEHLVILRKDVKGTFHPSIAEVPDRVEGSCQGALYATMGTTATEVFKRMTPDEFIERWKDYLKEVSGWLLKAETQVTPDPFVLSNISELVGCAGWMSKHFTVLNQPSANVVLSYNLEERCVETPDDAHWVRVLNSLHLTPEQRRDALSTRELFLTTNQKIMGERQRLLTAVEGTTEQKAQSIEDLLAQTKPLSEDLARRLSDNLVKQHTNTLSFNIAFLDKICTPLQFARATMYSYPFMPDSLALINVIAQEQASNS